MSREGVIPMADVIPVALSLIVIRSRDISRSMQFYQCLGLEFTTEKHGNGPEHFAAEISGLVFEIYPQPEGQFGRSIRLGFRVPSIQNVIERLEATGFIISDSTRAASLENHCVLTDPDGHRVELRS
jgi:lactoylglutathione lyase